MKSFLFILVVITISVPALFSCRQQDQGFLPAMEIQDSRGGSDGTYLSEDTKSEKNAATQAEYSSSPIYLFDYSVIKLVPTKSIDIAIKNCSLYQDIYGDLLILGEVLNNSDSVKTNLEITFDFTDRFSGEMDFKKIPAYAEYLQPGKKIPFCLIYEDRSRYIDIGEIKIGANYKNYNQSFSGYPVVTDENFSYYDDKMLIKGSLINLGFADIENVKLFATFYNLKNQVVFLRECYIEKSRLNPQEHENFSLAVLMDEYIPEFTHYRFEVFFRDALIGR